MKVIIQKIIDKCNSLGGFDYPYFCRYTREECKGEGCEDLRWNDFEHTNCPDRYYPSISERYKRNDRYTKNKREFK